MSKATPNCNVIHFSPFLTSFDRFLRWREFLILNLCLINLTQTSSSHWPNQALISSIPDNALKRLLEKPELVKKAPSPDLHSCRRKTLTQAVKLANSLRLQLAQSINSSSTTRSEPSRVNRTTTLLGHRGSISASTTLTLWGGWDLSSRPMTPSAIFAAAHVSQTPSARWR